MTKDEFTAMVMGTFQYLNEKYPNANSRELYKLTYEVTSDNFDGDEDEFEELWDELAPDLLNEF